MVESLDVQFIAWKMFHDWTNITRPRFLSAKLREYSAEIDEGRYKATLLGAEMLFTKHHFSNVINEFDSWSSVYLPTDVKDKVVLSVGEGCGETALFFIRNGARKVIAIEREQEPFELLQRNVRWNSLNVEPIRDSFRLEHLSLSYDFLKVDIEGGEDALLNLDPAGLKPCVIEAHRFFDKGLPEKLTERFGLRQIAANGKNAVLLTNVRERIQTSAAGEPSNGR